MFGLEVGSGAHATMDSIWAFGLDATKAGHLVYASCMLLTRAM